MKAIFNHIVTLGVVLVAASCAKTRRVEPVYDFDANRYEKGALLSAPVWKYKATVLDTSTYGGLVFTGIASNMYFGRFEFDRDQLRFVNTVTPYEDGGQRQTREMINAWSVQHSEYRLAEKDGKVSNKEEEDPTKTWEQKRFFKIDWKSAKMDFFSQTGNRCFEKIDERLVEGTQEVTSEHFTYTTEVTYKTNPYCYESVEAIAVKNLSGAPTFTMQVKHSFAPYVKSDYQPLVYKNEFDKNRPKYGFFETIVNSFPEGAGDPETAFQDQSLRRFILVNRWHPEKEHVFYFDENFPAEYKWIYNHPTIGIAARTNKLFEQHGLKMRVRFESDAKAKFGDVRYSFVKFIDKAQTGQPFGYGPSDADPTTGEILKSDSLVWTNPLQNYLRDFREYEKQNKNATEVVRPQIIQKIDQVLAEANVGVSFESLVQSSLDFDYRNIYGKDVSKYDDADRTRARYEFQKILKENLFNNPYAAEFTRPGDFLSDTLSENLADLMDPFKAERSSPYESGLSRTLRTTEEVGGATMSAADRQLLKYVHQQKLTSQHPELRLSMEQESRQLTGGHCKLELSDVVSDLTVLSQEGKTNQEIADAILYHVAIHEFGHNLNLRHNFYGSVDYDNFKDRTVALDRNAQPLKSRVSGNVIESFPTSSSVMEYVRRDQYASSELEWGLYDEAALVYAYSGGKTDLSKVNLEKAGSSPAYTLRSEKGLADRDFMYCTDQHAYYWYNPFCNTRDSGVTPTQMVVDFIKSYANSYRIANTPFNRAYWNAGTYSGYIADTMDTPYRMVAMLNELEMYLSKMSNDISSYPGGERQQALIREMIRKDLTNAVTLLSAFYGAVIKITDTERPPDNTVDRFTGETRIIGVLLDKIFALYNLAGYSAYQIDNSFPTSYVSLYNLANRSDFANQALGKVVTQQLKDIASERRLNRVGFESFGRSLLTSTFNDPTRGTRSALGRFKVMCFTSKGLDEYFGINVDKFVPCSEDRTLATCRNSNGDLQERELEAGFISLYGNGMLQQAGPGQYVDKKGLITKEGQKYAALVKISPAEYYMTVQENPDESYAFDYMSARIGLIGDNLDVSESAKDLLVRSKLLYDRAFYGSTTSCLGSP
jgi:hypothetical protein